MRDLNSIIDQIQSMSTYYWKLSVKAGFSETPLAAFIEERGKEEPNREESISLLQKTVSYYPDATTKFYVELLKTPNSSAGGRTGKLEFVRDLIAYSQAMADGGHSVGSLGNIGAATPGSGRAAETAYLEKIRELETARNEISLQRDRFYEERLAFGQSKAETERLLQEKQYDFKLDQKLFEQKKEAWEESRKETEKELKEKAARYDSKITPYKDGFEQALEGLIVRGLGFVPGAATSALAGAPAAEPLASEEEKLIEDIAQHVNAKIQDITELKTWGILTEKFIAEPQNLMFIEFREKARRVSNGQKTAK